MDGKQLIKPSAFMDLAQEIAYQTSTAMHFGFDDLRINHLVWVLARMQIRFHRRPRWNEAVDLSTWCKQAVSLFFLRDFHLADSEGNTLIDATTSWTVINSETRRMARGSDIEGIVDEKWICADSVFDNPAEKVAIPRNLTPQHITDHLVAYSDIDVVGHANNARYVAWAIDCVDYDYIEHHELSELSINFNHECKPGQTVSLMRCSDGCCWYVEGLVDGKPAFTVKMTFN